MRSTNILYWVFTGLFAALMGFSSIPDIFSEPKAVEFITALGYPAYLVPFLGVAKFLGVVAILVPGFPRLTEWAYAGLVIDLTGATYSQIATHMPNEGLIFMAFAFLLAFGSYYFYHKRRKARSGNVSAVATA
jgi:uncharacterized membrane protein YphA (DoxX/SURF4 family)